VIERRPANSESEEHIVLGYIILSWGPVAAAPEEPGQAGSRASPALPRSAGALPQQQMILMTIMILRSLRMMKVAR
jgi:hypothetical protein